MFKFKKKKTETMVILEDLHKQDMILQKEINDILDIVESQQKAIDGLKEIVSALQKSIIEEAE